MAAVPVQENKYYEGLEAFIENNETETWRMVMNFSKYIDRQHLSLFLARYEIFKKIVNIHGAIVECGVWNGNGLMSWAQFCAIMEPYNYVRRIIGFDTFKGFPSVDGKDLVKDKSSDRRTEFKLEVGQLKTNSYDELVRAVELFDQNRPIGHVKKIELVNGDAAKTIPGYVKNNPHLMVSLLNLDFDLYEPTKAAIECLVPRMPKGGVIIFDEANDERWPGETMALADTLGISSLKIERFPFEPKISYAVIQ